MSITPIIKITLTLKHKGESTPLAGEKYTVLLFDKDVFEDEDY